MSTMTTAPPLGPDPDPELPISFHMMLVLLASLLLTSSTVALVAVFAKVIHTLGYRMRGLPEDDDGDDDGNEDDGAENANAESGRDNHGMELNSVTQDVPSPENLQMVNHMMTLDPVPPDSDSGIFLSNSSAHLGESAGNIVAQGGVGGPRGYRRLTSTSSSDDGRGGYADGGAAGVVVGGRTRHLSGQSLGVVDETAIFDMDGMGRQMIPMSASVTSMERFAETNDSPALSNGQYFDGRGGGGHGHSASFKSRRGSAKKYTRVRGNSINSISEDIHEDIYETVFNEEDEESGSGSGSAGSAERVGASINRVRQMSGHFPKKGRTPSTRSRGGANPNGRFPRFPSVRSNEYAEVNPSQGAVINTHRVPPGAHLARSISDPHHPENLDRVPSLNRRTRMNSDRQSNRGRQTNTASGIYTGIRESQMDLPENFYSSPPPPKPAGVMPLTGSRRQMDDDLPLPPPEAQENYYLSPADPSIPPRSAETDFYDNAVDTENIYHSIHAPMQLSSSTPALGNFPSGPRRSVRGGSVRSGHPRTFPDDEATEYNVPNPSRANLVIRAADNSGQVSARGRMPDPAHDPDETYVWPDPPNLYEVLDSVGTDSLYQTPSP